jgi:HEAT repeat protein
MELGPRSLGDLELNRFPGLALKHGRPLPDMPGGEDVDDFQADEVASAKLAVDRNIEEHEVADAIGELQLDADCPNMLGLKTDNQKMTVAAMQMALMNVWAQRSYLVAILRQSLSLATMRSTRLRCL